MRGGWSSFGNLSAGSKVCFSGRTLIRTIQFNRRGRGEPRYIGTGCGEENTPIHFVFFLRFPRIPR
jgi:hypothetical protein